MIYRITIFKMVQEDQFEAGCVGNATDMGEIFRFESSSLELVRERCPIDLSKAEFYEEENRLEMATLEDGNGDEPTAHAIECWKKNDNPTLYHADYSIYLETIEQVNVDPRQLVTELIQKEMDQLCDHAHTINQAKEWPND